MKRILVLGCLGLALAGPAAAGEQTVSYKSGDETVSSFLVTPEGQGAVPGRRS